MTPLFRAPAVLRLLLENNADLTYADEDGNSYLHLARNPNQVQMLYSAGCRKGLTNNMGQTPLHTACNHEIARVMVEEGEDITQRDSRGRTAIHEAAAWGDVEMVKNLILLHPYPLIHLTDNNGRRPVELAREWLEELQSDPKADPQDVQYTMDTIRTLQEPNLVKFSEPRRRPR